MRPTNHDDSAWRSRRGARTLRVLGAAHRDARLVALGDRCRELEAGLFNAERDPEPIFQSLPYRDVMIVALRDPVVARVLTQLPADWVWPRE